MASRPQRGAAGGDRPVRALLDDLEEGIETLRVAYEKYFLGLEKRPPAREHDRVRKLLRALESRRLARPSLRFRLEGLRARLVTYEQYWTRTLRQIEEGTYRRHLARVKKGAAAVARPKAEERSPPVDPAEARRLYRELVAAKKAAGETTKGLSYGAFVRTLERTVPKLRAQHGREVELRVVQRDGKVKLVARPR